jgi:FkbM family methyltransferase
MLSRVARELLYIKPKDLEFNVIFDVGANVGTFALACSRLFKPKVIYCFEPVPVTYSCLQKNTSHLSEIITCNMGLSNFVGDSGMIFDQDYSAISRLSSKKDNIKVKLTTLKDFVAQNNISQIDLLKIDVESSENLVLEGCGDFLSKVKYIYMEVTIKDNPNYTISSLMSLLYGMGYNFQLVYYRNASNKSHGPIVFMDFLLENIEFKN